MKRSVRSHLEQGTSQSQKITARGLSTTANNLNIRAGAGTNYKYTGSITDHGVYTIVAEADGQGATKWGKLKSGAGWISLDYTEKL